MFVIYVCCWLKLDYDQDKGWLIGRAASGKEKVLWANGILIYEFGSLMRLQLKLSIIHTKRLIPI